MTIAKIDDVVPNLNLARGRMSSVAAPVEAPARTIRGFGALMITLSSLSPTIGVFVVGSDLIWQG